MHRLLPVQKPPRWWSPKLSPAWVRFWRPVRRWAQRHEQRLRAIEVRGLEHLQRADAKGHGVLITPNHVQYADVFVLAEAADRLGRPFYFMSAWQVLGMASPLRRSILRQHGCFSVDRDGTDLRAFRQAVKIMETQSHPLVIFPEGEMYHVNDRVTPFREGAAAIALAAARRPQRPVVCAPCGIKYFLKDDPTPELLRLADRIEEKLLWRPRRDLPLEQRIYRVAEGALALKEIEHLGQIYSGALPQRIQNLSEAILRRLEQHFRLDPRGRDVPARVKSLRQQVVKELETLPESATERRQYAGHLEEIFLVVQLFCYPGDYVAERPSLERMAETLAKFEEDLLGVAIAAVRGTWHVVIAFGEPIVVPQDRDGDKASTLTRQLEERVQGLLNELTG